MTKHIGYPISGIWPHPSHISYPLSHTRYLTHPSHISYPASGLTHPISHIPYLTSGLWPTHPISHIPYLTSGIWNHPSRIPHHRLIYTISDNFYNQFWLFFICYSLVFSYFRQEILKSIQLLVNYSD
jgi:hypothetical protein